MSEGLQGKVILIAGATGVLGTAVAREFAQSGARLALSARSTDKLEALRSELGLSEDRALVAPADAAKEDQVRDLVDRITAQLGEVDVLLNTVGGWRGGKAVWQTDPEELDRILDLNLRPAYLLSRAVLPHMLDAEWGRIIHIGSKSALEPRARGFGQAVSKMGVVILTQVIAAEVKGSGVTANVILPSIIDTPGNRETMSRPDPSKWVPPEHIAEAMRFLCSEAAGSINGASIPIYGAV